MNDLFAHYDESQAIFINDLFVAPFVFFIILYIAHNKIKSKKDFIYKTYFFNGLIIKLCSSILLAFIYQYYYHGGDTIVYFAYALKLKAISYENFWAFLDLAFNPNFSEFNAEYYIGSLSYGYFMNDSSRLIIRIALYLSYFFFNSYLSITFVFSVFCYYGCWKLFKLFYSLYPHLHKEFAISCLFLPSVCFWGSGLMKDSLSLGALGIMTYHLYMLVFKNTRIIGRSLIAVFCIYLIYEIKVYILLSYFPPFLLWLFLRARTIIDSVVFKTIVTPILIVLGVSSAIFILGYIAQNAEKYAIDSLVRTAKDTQNWLVYSSKQQGGSYYTLGDIDYSLIGVIKAFPKAVNVALFRPYLWEAKKPILIPAALEGLFSLFFTIRLLFRTGFIRFIKLIIINPEVQFCLVFSILFAFSVGFTSFNFGALVRYKIPCLPFYYMALFILADKEKMNIKLKNVTKNKKKQFN